MGFSLLTQQILSHVIVVAPPLGSCCACSPSGHQVTLMWESVIKFQQMQSSRYSLTLSLQVRLTACSPIVGRLEYGLLSEHAHKHTYVCDSSQTPGTMNNGFCPNNTCYIVLLYVYACEARHIIIMALCTT